MTTHTPGPWVIRKNPRLWLVVDNGRILSKHTTRRDAREAVSKLDRALLARIGRVTP